MPIFLAAINTPAGSGFGVPSSLDNNEQQKAYSLLDRHEEKAARISFPAQGAEGVIRELKKKDLPLGIITRNSLNAVLLALNNFDHVKADDFAII
ncbi:unnamed protein product, partial [marine sediment metagenome]